MHVAVRPSTAVWDTHTHTHITKTKILGQDFFFSHTKVYNYRLSLQNVKDWFKRNITLYKKKKEKEKRYVQHLAVNMIRNG